MSRFTGEEIDSLLGYPGPVPDLPESLLMRYERGPRRQPWHQLEEVEHERDFWERAYETQHKTVHRLEDECDRYRQAFVEVAEERDRYAETLRQLAKSADPLTRDKALEALRGG